VSSEQAHFLSQKAITEVLKSACLLDVNRKLKQINPNRLGLLISASKPLFGPSERVLSPEIVGEKLCEQFQIEGERRNIVAACATGAYSVALGASWIEQGLCDVVVAGSVEPPAHELIEAGFKQMGVVSKEETMRPFDRQRSGFVLGAGAGVVVLESERHAVQRGVPVLARLSGWGLGSDPHSAVAFNSNGDHIAQVIRKALKRAELPPRAIQHVNAHGTATRLNDWIETQALMKAFGSEAGNLMISGTKSSTGHLLGAAGSVELVLAVQALQNQFVPPTAHLQEPDPECPLDYTPGTGHAASFEHALSLSFGFGGPIGALIVSRN
jgi:3-oxoacyl-[acyl-carrier-protein] synthase II